MRGAALALLLGVAACAQAPTPPPRCEAGLKPAIGFTAMFGLLHHGQRISQAEWEGFEAHELTARFPSGYSLTEAMGSWRNPDGGIGREPSRFFFVLVPAEESVRARREIDAARDAYVDRFRQQSVGLMVQPACVAGLF